MAAYIVFGKENLKPYKKLKMLYKQTKICPNKTRKKNKLYILFWQHDASGVEQKETILLD